MQSLDIELFTMAQARVGGVVKNGDSEFIGGLHACEACEARHGTGKSMSGVPRRQEATSSFCVLRQIASW